jgi:hypothetical protein
MKMESSVKRAASPYATGGGGVVLEHAYGAVLLAALLRQNPIRGLGDEVTPVQARLQQGASYPVDVDGSLATPTEKVSP